MYLQSLELDTRAYVLYVDPFFFFSVEFFNFSIFLRFLFFLFMVFVYWPKQLWMRPDRYYCGTVYTIRCMLPHTATFGRAISFLKTTMSHPKSNPMNKPRRTVRPPLASVTQDTTPPPAHLLKARFLPREGNKNDKRLFWFFEDACQQQ